MHKLLILLLILLLVSSACSNNNIVGQVTVEQNKVKNNEAEKNENEQTNVKIPTEQLDDESITDSWETKGLFTPQSVETTKVETYKICENTSVENEITVLTAVEDGPTIFIIGGMHGDEIAGWMAVDKIKNMELKKGRVCIISPANLNGATAEPKTRYVSDINDLNRSFPGNANGNPAEILADGILQEILKYEPILVLDHHEARIVKEDKDFLGSSLIYTILDGIEEMFLDLHQSTQDGKLCASPFNFFGPGPDGSLNNYLGYTHNIPVITVETYRAYQLERRIEEHMAIIGYILAYYGMV